MKILRGDYQEKIFEKGQFDGIITAGPTGPLEPSRFNTFMSKAFDDTKDYGFLIVFTSIFEVPDLVLASKIAEKKEWVLYEKQVWAKGQMHHADVQFILYFGKNQIPPGQEELFSWWKGTVVPGQEHGARSGGYQKAKYEGKYSFPIFDEILDDQIHEERDKKSPMYGKPKPQAEIQFDDGTTHTVWNFEKPEDFSWMFKQIVSGRKPSKELRQAKKNESLIEKSVLDPYLIGTGEASLIMAFPNSIGIRASR
jgi:hypothetical protein